MRELLLWVKGELAAGRSAELLEELAREIALGQSLEGCSLEEKVSRTKELRWPTIRWGELAMVAGMVCLFSRSPAWESELVAVIGQELDRGEVYR